MQKVLTPFRQGLVRFDVSSNLNVSRRSYFSDKSPPGHRCYRRIRNELPDLCRFLRLPCYEGDNYGILFAPNDACVVCQWYEVTLALLKHHDGSQYKLDYIEHMFHRVEYLEEYMTVNKRRMIERPLLLAMTKFSDEKHKLRVEKMKAEFPDLKEIFDSMQKVNTAEEDYLDSDPRKYNTGKWLKSLFYKLWKNPFA